MYSSYRTPAVCSKNVEDAVNFPSGWFAQVVLRQTFRLFIEILFKRSGLHLASKLLGFVGLGAIRAIFSRPSWGFFQHICSQVGPADAAPGVIWCAIGHKVGARHAERH